MTTEAIAERKTGRIQRIKPKLPKNLADVRDELCRTAHEVNQDMARVPQAHEAANALGKVVMSCKVYLEYSKMTKKPISPEWNAFMGG